MHVALTPVTDFDALGLRWQTLQRASDHSAFLDWSFLGCLAETRFANALLLSVRDAQGDALLALLRNGRLNETGDPEQDAVFIEHNGFLVRRGAGAAIGLAFQAVRRFGPLTLSGVDTAFLAAARRSLWVGPVVTRLAPYAALPAGAPSALDAVPQASANLRAQLRRSFRLFGPELTLARARSLDEAQAWFLELVALHQAAWRARGQPGAFANPAIVAFHRALIARGVARGVIDLLRITAAERTIGILYQFNAGNRVYAYQSGFAVGTDNREKPGLVCHALAMAHYARQGIAIYDFLAGDARYKRSLSTGALPLHWTTLYPPWSPRGCLALARRALARSAINNHPA